MTTTLEFALSQSPATPALDRRVPGQTLPPAESMRAADRAEPDVELLHRVLDGLRAWRP